jgi:hypothetical protein
MNCKNRRGQTGAEERLLRVRSERFVTEKSDGCESSPKESKTQDEPLSRASDNLGE